MNIRHMRIELRCMVAIVFLMILNSFFLGRELLSAAPYGYSVLIPFSHQKERAQVDFKRTYQQLLIEKKHREEVISLCEQLSHLNDIFHKRQVDGVVALESLLKHAGNNDIDCLLASCYKYIYLSFCEHVYKKSDTEQKKNDMLHAVTTLYKAKIKKDGGSFEYPFRAALVKAILWLRSIETSDLGCDEKNMTTVYYMHYIEDVFYAINKNIISFRDFKPEIYTFISSLTSLFVARSFITPKKVLLIGFIIALIGGIIVGGPAAYRCCKTWGNEVVQNLGSGLADAVMHQLAVSEDTKQFGIHLGAGLSEGACIGAKDSVINGTSALVGGVKTGAQSAYSYVSSYVSSLWNSKKIEA